MDILVFTGLVLSGFWYHIWQDWTKTCLSEISFGALTELKPLKINCQSCHQSYRNGHNQPVFIMNQVMGSSVWKSSPRTGKRLQPNWTKTKQDQDQKRLFVGLLQSWSWSFHFGEIKKTEKNRFKPVFFRTNYVHINYHIGTIFRYFIIFFWNLFM